MPLDASLPTPSGLDPRSGPYRGSPLSTPAAGSPAPKSSQKPSSRSKQRGRHAGVHRSDSECYTDGQGTHAEEDSGSDRIGTPTRTKGVNRQGATAPLHTRAGSMSPGNLKKSNQHPRGPRMQDRQRSSLLARSEERPSDLAGSHAPGRADALSPERNISTPIKAAYAAPTFSASPAPSALPIPKLLSKSVPEAVVKGSMQARLVEESPKASTTTQNREISQLKEEDTAREPSPLDIFFRADREEKARARSIALGHITCQTAADRGSPSEPSHRPSYGHARHLTEISSSDMFSMEIDGLPPSHGQEHHHAHPSSHERIPVIRSHTVPAATTGHEDENEQRRSQSKALKDMLGIISR